MSVVTPAYAAAQLPGCGDAPCHVMTTTVDPTSCAAKTRRLKKDEFCGGSLPLPLATSPPPQCEFLYLQAEEDPAA